MTEPDEFDLDYATEQLRRSRHPLRKLIKKLYLDRILVDVSGPTIDFGCGAGQLLTRLPAGSVGLELNKSLVDALNDAGLKALFYDANADDFSLSVLGSDRYQTFVISHVLEHFHNTAIVMRQLWATCNRLGIDTIVAVVPGAKGYESDVTHKTFLTEQWLSDNGLIEFAGFHLDKLDYFPLNRRCVGDYFVFHELKLVYRRTPAGRR